MGCSSVFFASIRGTARAPAYLAGGGGGRALPESDGVSGCQVTSTRRGGSTYNMPKDIGAAVDAKQLGFACHKNEVRDSG